MWLRLTAAASLPAAEPEFVTAPAAPDKATSPVRSLRRRAVRWYVLGLAGLGTAVGCLAGLSENPVVGALLPVLGALMMAGASFYLAKASLSSEENLEKLRVIGVATGFFAISVIIGTVYGVSIRGGFSFADFVPRWSPNDPPALPGKNEVGFAQATRLLALRSRLQLLGATDDEVRQILTLASATLKQEQQEGVRPMLVQAFARETRQIQADVKTLLTRMPEKPSEEAEEDWFALQAMALRIERTLPTIDALEKRSGALSVSDTDLLFSIAEQLKRGLRDIRGSKIVRSAANATGVNVARFDVWAESLNALTRPPEAEGISSFDRMVRDVDGLVGTASGKADEPAAQPRARRPAAKRP